MIEIEYIDLSKEINSIVYKNGLTARGGEEYNERAKEANKIWRFETNGHSVVTPDEVIHLGTDYKYNAEIRIAKGGNDLWAMSTSYMLPNQGSSSPISVFERIGFRLKDDAILFGIQSLQKRLEKIMNTEHERKSDKDGARYLINLLEEQKKPQLDLF